MEGRTPYTTFGRKLRSELVRQDVSVRELARRISPRDFENQRRTIARWLTPSPEATTPSPASRRASATALGLDPTYFEEDDDEMPLSRETQALIVEMFARVVAEARA